MAGLIPIERIENKIYLIRGQKVMLDWDLAELYGVETKRLNEQVKRNIERFPRDFMFQLSKEEAEVLNTMQMQPAFLLEHIFYDLDDEPVSWGKFICRGDHFEFRAKVGIRNRK